MPAHSILFLSDKFSAYPTKEPPTTIPVLEDGEKVGLAVFYDSKYTFELPGHLSTGIRMGLLIASYVFENRNGTQSYDYLPGSQLIAITIEEEQNLLEL